MSTDILMPALSPTMEEGTLAKWLKAEGDTVSSGDIIAEIETDKATMEVEAVDEGVLAKILVAEGTEGVAVNSVIAVLADEGESVDASSPTFGQAEDGESPDPESKIESDSHPETVEGEGRAVTQPTAITLTDPTIPEGTAFTETTVRDALRDVEAV